MDEEHIESSSLSEAKDILTQLGGWPVLLGDTWAGFMRPPHGGLR